MDFKEYLLELKKYSPYDFSEYSDNSIQRRLHKIMESHELTLEQLHAKTISDSAFVEQLVNDITVNTTEFFRDPEVWIEYWDSVLPLLNSKKQIKIWHAGSSTGQEVYSNAILLDHCNLLKKTQVFATDINQLVLNDALNGAYRYSNNIKNLQSFEGALSQVANTDTKVNVMKYFSINATTDTLSIHSSLKSVPIFKKHDLVKDSAPFEGKFDIIFCRNVLIYFNTTLQSKILKMFHENLLPGGMLILGNHESLHGFFKTRFTKGGNFYIKNNTFHFKY